MDLNCSFTNSQTTLHLFNCDSGQQLVTAGSWYPDWIFIPVVVIVLLMLFFLLSRCLHIAPQWERVVLLRLGHFKDVVGPGFFWTFPFFRTIAERVSVQVIVTHIKAEKTLTKDTVPVDVQAVLFWKIHDPRAAVIDVDDYEESIAWTAQVALREAIGAHDFVELLSQRDRVDVALQAAVSRKASAWGIEVQAIEIKDVQIPEDLQEAMSREAQAEREQHARVILGQSEIQIAEKFVEAAKIYQKDPVAIQLRAMNIIYETTKERGSTILLPTSIVDSLSGLINK